MNRTILTNSITLFLAEEQHERRDAVSLYDAWITRTGFRVEDRNLAAWLLDFIRASLKSNTAIDLKQLYL